MRVVVGRRELEDRPELVGGLVVAADAEVRDPERLADRRLVRLPPLRLLERHGRLCRHPLLQVPAALLEVVVDLAHNASTTRKLLLQTVKRMRQVTRRADLDGPDVELPPPAPAGTRSPAPTAGSPAAASPDRGSPPRPATTARPRTGSPSAWKRVDPAVLHADAVPVRRVGRDAPDRDRAVLSGRGQEARHVSGREDRVRASDQIRRLRVGTRDRVARPQRLGLLDEPQLEPGTRRATPGSDRPRCPTTTATHSTLAARNSFSSVTITGRPSIGSTGFA